MQPGVKIRLKSYKPLTRNDIVEMIGICLSNARYLRATIHHLSAMVEALSSKKDEDARKGYQRRIKRAQSRLEEEEGWILVYETVLSKNK